MIKKSRFIQTIILLVFCLLPALASAKTERYVLHYGDSTFSSHNRQSVTLFLKRELTRQHPGLDLSQYRLEKVVIMARSYKGKGSAQLRIDNKYSQSVRISGSPKAFKKSDRFNYDKKTLYNPTGSNRGPWQLKLQGNIQIRKLVLVVDKHSRNKDRHYGYKPPHSSFKPVVLPAKTWGTRLEGERSCSRGSLNARDGWDFPNSICGSSARAIFRGGYHPTRLYIRPDISPLKYLGHQRISQLGITVTLNGLNHNQNHSGSATLGVDIGGRTFTRKIALNGMGNSTTESLTISGKWHHADVANCHIWILPHNNSGDITVKQLQMRVKKVI